MLLGIIAAKALVKNHECCNLQIVESQYANPLHFSKSANFAGILGNL